MNIYTRKQRWKKLLLIMALLIGIGSLWYTNRLVGKLQIEEKKKVMDEKNMDYLMMLERQ